MMHRKWSIFWMSSEKLGTGGRRASAVPNLMYSILIIAQNRGNFLGNKLLLYPTADKEAKNKQRAGEKPKKRCTHDSTQWNFWEKSFCCAQPLTRKSKTSSAQGKKPKKRCTHDSTQRKKSKKRCTHDSAHPLQQLKNINYQV